MSWAVTWSQRSGLGSLAIVATASPDPIAVLGLRTGRRWSGGRLALMKRVFSSAILAVALGCGGGGGDEFVAQLEALGFFDYAPAANAARMQVSQNGWPGIFGDNGRTYFADAETLAEGGVGSFLEEIRPFLESQGVAFPDLEEISDEHYSVTVDGREHPIYTRRDLYDEDRPGLIWGLATARGFAIVNDLLEAAGSTERLYAVNGGNDLLAFFLTPELRRAIVDHPDATAVEGPYEPSEQYPWFGQPGG